MQAATGAGVAGTGATGTLAVLWRLKQASPCATVPGGQAGVPTQVWRVFDQA